MQSTNEILMIRPINFNYNTETAKDNIYQTKIDENKDDIQNTALLEFDNMVKILRKENIKVNVFQDTDDIYTPDSIFPNNWFSTHNGKLIIYPMYAPNRQAEVDKFLDKLINLYKPTDILDLRCFIKENKFLESTGAMIFDREGKTIYSTLSKRADEEIIKIVADYLDYDYFTFYSYQDDAEIYHTNVLMSITSKFLFYSQDLIDEKYVIKLLQNSLINDRIGINLSPKQIKHFAGNVLELNANGEKLLIISANAYNSLNINQITLIETKMKIVPIPVKTIETIGGGSVRCMVGEIFR